MKVSKNIDSLPEIQTPLTWKLWRSGCPCWSWPSSATYPRPFSTSFCVWPSPNTSCSRSSSTTLPTSSSTSGSTRSSGSLFVVVKSGRVESHCYFLVLFVDVTMLAQIYWAFVNYHYEVMLFELIHLVSLKSFWCILSWRKIYIQSWYIYMHVL